MIYEHWADVHVVSPMVLVCLVNNWLWLINISKPSLIIQGDISKDYNSTMLMYLYIHYPYNQ